MKFQYSVIGDNTQENREWLEMIGYKFRFGSTSTRNDYRFIKTKVLCTNIGNTYAIADLKYTINDVEEENTINCIGNSPLFKAVSAMRDDSDYMQYRVSKQDGLVLCPYQKFNGYQDLATGEIDMIPKATITELQERFKEKER